MFLYHRPKRMEVRFKCTQASTEMWHKDILGTVGDTPLVQLNRLAEHLTCTVLVKLEAFNPAGSVKDRIAVEMVEEAERSGSLKPGGTVVEATSGNTGTGVAMVAVAKGYRCICATTDKVSKEKVDSLRAYGATVVICPKSVHHDDPRSYYSVARRLAAEMPNAVYLNQYFNQANTLAHYRSTGPEIWEQTEGHVSHVFAGASTGGTISGVARYLKEKKPDIKIIGVDPFGSAYYTYFFTREIDENEVYSYNVEGAGKGFLAGNLDVDVIDDYTRVRDRDTMAMVHRLVKEEGIFAGQSSGLVAAGALEWLEGHTAVIGADALAVLILPDSGVRYLSKTFNEDWMREHNLL